MLTNPHIGEGVLSPTEPEQQARSLDDLFWSAFSEQFGEHLDRQFAKFFFEADGIPEETHQVVADMHARSVPDVFGGGLTTGEIVWTPQAIAAHFQVHPGRVDFEVGNDGPELFVPVEWLGRGSIP